VFQELRVRLVCQEDVDLLEPQGSRVDKVRGVNEELLDHRANRDNQAVRALLACPVNQESREHLEKVGQMVPLVLGENGVHRESVVLLVLLVPLEIPVNLVFLVPTAKLVREVFLAPQVLLELLVLQVYQDSRDVLDLLVLRGQREKQDLLESGD